MTGLLLSLALTLILWLIWPRPTVKIRIHITAEPEILRALREEHQAQDEIEALERMILTKGRAR